MIHFNGKGDIEGCYNEILVSGDISFGDDKTGNLCFQLSCYPLK